VWQESPKELLECINNGWPLILLSLPLPPMSKSQLNPCIFMYYKIILYIVSSIVAKISLIILFAGFSIKLLMTALCCEKLFIVFKIVIFTIHFIFSFNI
jgi:hypothetical protein